LGSTALRKNTEGGGNTAIGCYALLNNWSGDTNTATGVSALYNNTTGYGNTATGVDALSSNTSGNYNTAIGFEANVTASDLQNATAIGYGATVNASNKIRLGNGGVTVIEGQVAYSFPSDKNKKENFLSIAGEEVLKKLSDFTVTSWNYIGQKPKQFRHYGPTAQEFFAAFGNDGVGTCGDSTTINSGDMAGILMIAVQALEKRTREVEVIKSENKELRSELDQIKTLVNKLAEKSNDNRLLELGLK
jgi:hypothetical protein